MREIKFRCWIERYNDFKYWGFVDDVFIGPPTGGQLSIQECKELSEQFTGLHDRNGKDIYENDIVKGFFDTDEVEDYLWMQLTEDEKKSGTKIFHITDIFYAYRFPLPEILEVIGNIHENPDLLK